LTEFRPRALERQSPRRRRRRQPQRPPHRPAVTRRPKWTWRIAAAAAVSGFALLLWAIIARQLAPHSNTSLTRFDAIIVLGSPADSDGNPTPYQLSRATEAVHEYERGVAPHIILTGSSVHNRFTEARVMERVAHAQGVPEAALFIEPESRDTIQNLCFAASIMHKHGWRSAEVVSSAVHLPRAALILEKLPIEWRVHEAPPLGSGSSMFTSADEILKTARYLLLTQWAERCEP
jgi:uncharacterized SAM-binding protein YcdF (DUF218 family)